MLDIEYLVALSFGKSAHAAGYLPSWLHAKELKIYWHIYKEVTFQFNGMHGD
jgi:hypothetical protein